MIGVMPGASQTRPGAPAGRPSADLVAARTADPALRLGRHPSRESPTNHLASVEFLRVALFRCDADRACTTSLSQESQ